MTTTHDYWKAYHEANNLLKELEWHPLEFWKGPMCELCKSRHTHYKCPICGNESHSMDFEIDNMGMVYTFLGAIANHCWNCESLHLIAYGIPGDRKVNTGFYIASSPKED